MSAESGAPLSQEDIECCAGLADIAERILECVLWVKHHQQQLREEVLVHAKPSPPSPGGWPKFAFLVLLCWPETGIDRVFELLGKTEGVTADMILWVQHVRVLLKGARQVFATRQAELKASGNHQYVFGVAQAMAATMFQVFHEQDLWNGGGCCR